MNIFVLDKDPMKCAESLDDVRLKRLAFENLEMISMAVYLHIGKLYFPYRSEHLNHPVAVWVRSDLKNLQWALRYGLECCNEYKYRFNRSIEYFRPYFKLQIELGFPPDTSSKVIFRNSTIKFKHISDITQAYRLHYKWKLTTQDKIIPKTFTKRPAPEWLKVLLSEDMFEDYTKYIKEI